MKNGIFVVIEGIDGAGKTTLAKALKEKADKERVKSILSREPTDGPHGKKIREFAIKGRPSPEEELHLFVEDRKEHVEKIIKPALDRKNLVILDRYYYSTMAYQGAAGVPMKDISDAHRDFILEPDLLILLELDLNEALSRASQRGKLDEFEKRDYLAKVADNYSKIHKYLDYLKTDFISMDATLSQKSILGDIWENLMEMGVKKERSFLKEGGYKPRKRSYVKAEK